MRRLRSESAAGATPAPGGPPVLRRAGETGGTLAAVPGQRPPGYGGPHRLQRLTEAVGDFLTKDNRQALSKDLSRFLVNAMGKKDAAKEVLPFLGPEIGLVLAVPADPKHAFPEGVLALQVQPGDKASPVDQALLNQLNFFANLAVFGHAQRFPNQPLEMKTMTIGKTSATYLESAALPPGVQPAYALREGFLLVSSSPEWIRRFAAPTARSAPDALRRSCVSRSRRGAATSNRSGRCWQKQSPRKKT